MEAEAELPPSLLKISTYVYRFPLPATKVVKFSRCFGDNLGAEETKKTIRWCIALIVKKWIC